MVYLKKIRAGKAEEMKEICSQNIYYMWKR